MAFPFRFCSVIWFACDLPLCSAERHTRDTVSVLFEVKPICLWQRVGNCALPAWWRSRVAPLAQRASVPRCSRCRDDHSRTGCDYGCLYWISCGWFYGSCARRVRGISPGVPDGGGVCAV